MSLRLPHEPDAFLEADAVLGAPLTFSTINKWAAGISDTLALGLLNEPLVEGLPIVAAPCVKAAIRTHPAYPAGIERLRRERRRRPRNLRLAKPHPDLGAIPR